ncbi:polysaccharide deacetylase family protein [Halovibrio salipaludis]|uniref:Polysaccharide deacetylase family protein n=1 Tax=Halovibrio salipaludis TaxID=2032626 RepID=A0A2A2F8R9_9GAMM|nr:XrtA system polysaccharide deacetylase [Halovibrio salipaludis]PAU81220.1 polysaccharide deacetylase family protein [Halovibrio salipaludis]
MTPTPNALTIDVEDYFHVAALSEAISPDDWPNTEYRCEANTDRILELFDAHHARGTFFVLGWVADRSPALIRRIADAGHEIASHGYSHQLVYNQTPEVFREETVRSKHLLEDITGQPVTGYRAASYSITNESRWALDILAESGFTWDSSIFPVRHDRYGMPGTSRWPYRLTTDKGHELVEFPLSTLQFGSTTVPIAGGGYFRLFPYWFSRWGLGSLNRQGRSFIFYLHPWEIDPGQPRFNVSWFSKFRHYNNLEKCEARLESLLQDFDFTTVTDVLTRNETTPVGACSARDQT